MTSSRPTQATPPARVLAVMGAVLVLLLALVVTAGRAGAATPVGGGHIDWGVKASFRSYVTGPVASGSITTGDGVSTNPDGTYRFGSGSGTADGATSAIALSTIGSVHFVGHEGALDIQFTDVRVDIVGSSGTLVVDAVSKPFPSGAAVTYDDVALATLDLSGTVPTVSGGSHTFAALPATLTAAGAPAFGGFYPAGTALDPVTVVVELTPPTTSTSTTSTSTTTVPGGGSTTTSSTVPGEATTTTSTVPGSPDPDSPGLITGGYLDWGVKASFRGYVTGPIANGAVTTSDGATTNADGSFRFPAAAGSARADGEAFDATFGGSVRFTGHAGELELGINGLEVHADGAAGVLVADVASHEIGASESTTYDDVELAALDLSEVTAGSDALTVTWADIDASLTAAGAPSFGGFYEAGAALDPLTVVLEVEATTVPPGDAGTGVDGATVDKTTLAPGDELTVTGAGFTPGEQVEVWLHSDPSWMGTTVTDSAGVVSFTFELPLDLDPGQHHIELIGISSGLVLASPDFTVTGSGVGAGAVTPTGALPYTGADSVAVGAAGATLLGAGLGLAVVARRRLRATAT